MKAPEEIFPEYFIIRVNEFNKVATTPLEEWIDYLKNGHIKDDTTAPGLSEARKKLQYLSMNKQERLAYDKHIDAMMVQNDVLDTARLEGLAEGREEGLAKGRAEGRAEGAQQEKLDTIHRLQSLGLSVEQIALGAGMSIDEVKKLLK